MSNNIDSDQENLFQIPNAHTAASEDKVLEWAVPENIHTQPRTASMF